MKPSFLLCGHFREEVWGLAVRPTKAAGGPADGPDVAQYCTTGDDGFLRVWSLEEKKQINYLDVRYKAMLMLIMLIE